VRPSDAVQLREILAVLSFPDSVTRLEEVRSIVDEIKGCSLKSWERTISFEFFDYAVQAYLFGFDHAVIYYAALAVELALATSLGQILRYPELIKEARDKLGGRLVEDARDLNFLRNCYVHYQNLYQYSSQVEDAEISEAIGLVKDIDNEAREQILRCSEILSESSKRRFSVPVARNPYLKRRYRNFLRRRSEEYLKWFRRRGFGPIQVASGIEEGIRWYDRRGYDALDAIKKSHQILCRLGAFEKV
jgi:hypothetical protein